jgi:hypothetical protein
MRPTGRSKDILHKAKGDHIGQVHSDHKVLKVIRKKGADLFDRRLRVSKLCQEVIRLESTQIRLFLWWPDRRLMRMSRGRTQELHSLKLKPRETTRLESTQIRQFLWWPDGRLGSTWVEAKLKGYTLSSLNQEELTGSSPLRSDCSFGSQEGKWTNCPVARDAKMRVGKQFQTAKEPN